MNKFDQYPDDLFQRLRLLDILEKISRIRHASDNLEAFLSDVLDLLLDVFDADRACLLYACDPDAPSWSVPMERTRPEWPGVFALGVDMPMQPGMAEEFRFMLAEQRAVPFGSPGARAVPADVAERFSIKSQINTLLRPIVGKPWEMGIHHCVEPHAYSEQDLFLFDAIAERITDVLGSLLSIKQLRESERHFRA